MQDLQFRTEKFIHTSSSVGSLVSAGVLGLRQLESESTLTASDMTAKAGSSFATVPELIVEITAPLELASMGATPWPAHQTKVRNDRKKHFLDILDASAAEDRRLALAHFEENELKLAIQESLSDCQEVTMDESSDGAKGSDIEQTVVLLKFLRPSRALREALLSAPELAECRASLENRGYAVELPAGSKVFVAPFHYTPLMEAIRLGKWRLFPEHVFVDPNLEDVLLGVVNRLPRSAKVYCNGEGLKRYSIPTSFASTASHLDASLSVERTFINVRVPSSLLSASSAAGPATV